VWCSGQRYKKRAVYTDGYGDNNDDNDIGNDEKIIINVLNQQPRGYLQKQHK